MLNPGEISVLVMGVVFGAVFLFWMYSALMAARGDTSVRHKEPPVYRQQRQVGSYTDVEY